MRAILLMCLAGWSGPVAAAGFQTLELPSHTQICGAAIAGDGAIAGNAYDPGGTAPATPFTLIRGQFATPQPAIPQGRVTLTGISRAHLLAGYDLVTPPNQLFSYTSFKMRLALTTTLSRPNAVWTVATGMNDAGMVVGTAQDSPGGPATGFLMNRRVWTLLDDNSGLVQPAAIDATGSLIVGSSTNVVNGATHGWLFSQGHFSRVAFPGATETFPHGVDQQGRIDGTYFSHAGGVRTTHGFVYARGVYQTVDVPGASATQIYGLNDAGQFTGCYTDRTGTYGLAGQF